MAETDAFSEHNNASTGIQSATTYNPPTRRRPSFRRRKLPTVRLGAGVKNRRRFFLVRIFRRVRLRTFKLKYGVMVKKLREYYRSLPRDWREGCSSADAFQQRLILETSFAVPVFGFFNYFSNNHA